MALLTGSSWGPLRIAALTKGQHHTARAAWRFQPGQKWAGTQGHTDGQRSIASLALSVDDKRPQLLTLSSPRGGDMVPRSHWLCRLAYTSVTLGTELRGVARMSGGLLSEEWTSWASREGAERLKELLVALLLGPLSEPLHDQVPRHYLAPCAMTESWRK